MQRLVFFGLAIIVCQMLASPVLAHKVVASVWVDGAVIEGEIGLSNGDMAPEGIRVAVSGAGGEVFGEVFTDADGLFRFTPARAVAHIFRADLGAGHIAEAILAVEELPLGLVPVAGAATTASTDPVVATAVTSAGLAVAATAELEALISTTLRRELKPLRRELAAYKEKNDLQSVLGGLGYICGIFGLIFFIYARRGKTVK